jgi:hypothetical protein
MSADSNTGSRLLPVHAISEDGFAVGALYMYKAGQQVLITMADEQSEP